NEADINALLLELRRQHSEKPGRVFAGRGGNWGRDFRVAETPVYMHLSTYGIPTILWLPETWSPNSDTEQYFSENNPAHYALYNVRYVVTPPDLPKEQIQPFWKLLQQTTTWKLYEVTASVILNDSEGSGRDSSASPRNDNFSPTTPEVNGPPTSGVKAFGYIATGLRPAIVSSNKESFSNVVRLWLHSDYPAQGLYPQLMLSSNNVAMQQFNNLLGNNLPRFIMRDGVTYETPDNKLHNLFAEIPRYINPTNTTNPTNENQATIEQYNNITILSQETEADMIFRAKVEVKKDCNECIIVLRQTFHPSWRATIDGKPVKTFTVFPFFTAVKLESAGTHEVVFSYQPSTLKLILLAFSVVSLVALGILGFKQFNNRAIEQ
ncbi:MAG: YfhO family protein, partial [Nitrospirota bacterium]